MALSVSGFPEPSRHTEVYVGEDIKSTLISSPRLRGLFGASSSSNSNSGNKKSTTTTTSKQEEPESSSTTPPTTPGFSFPGSSFEPLSQQEYELEFQLSSSSASSSSKRPRLPSLPRRTSPSPVRLGPNLTRFDIGAWSRSPTTLLHSSSTTTSKPAPLLPSVVVEEWGGSGGVTKGGGGDTATMQQPRPLPTVPGGIIIKDPSAKSSSSNEPIPAAAKPPPTAAPKSKHVVVNAVAGPSKHVNAVAGPSKLQLSSSPPTSKVLLTQNVSHKTPASLSMRYQPLVAGTSAESALKDITVCTSVRPLPRIPPPATGDVAAPTPAPASSVDPTPGPSTPPPLVKPKRPKTSPSAIMTGFVLPSPPGSSSSNGGSTTTTTNAAVHRSPFVVDSSWASKPVDLQLRTGTGTSTRRPSSPPLPICSGTVVVKMPRSRSHSRGPSVQPLHHQQQLSQSSSSTTTLRTRRDRSLDSYYAKHGGYASAVAAAMQVAPLAQAAGASVMGARAPRSLPSPTILGARPPVKKAATMDTDPSNATASAAADSNPTSKTLLKIQTTPALSRSKTHTHTHSNSYAHTRVTSPVGKRTLPPSPPTGPVKPRSTKPPASVTTSPIISPIATPVVTPRSLPQLHLRISVSAPPTRSPSLEKPETIIPLHERKTSKLLLLKGQDEWRDEVNSIESPLHSHPPIDDAISLSSNFAPLSPTNTNANTANPNSTPNNASLLPNSNPNPNPNASLLPNSSTTTTPTLESPIEVFIDDLHHSTLSRSPSPIRYARPDSHDGYLSDFDLDFGDDGDDINNILGDGDVEMEWVLAAAPGDGVDGEETSDYSEAGMSGEGDAGGAAGGATGGYGSRRRGRRRREQLRSYRNSYRPRGANDASPPRIPYRSVSPSPATGVERRGLQKTEKDKDKEKEKEKEKEKAKDKSNKSKNNNSKKKKSELGKGLRGSLNSLSTPDTHTRASSPEPGERKSRSRQPRKLAEAVSAALEEVVASALEEVRTRNRGGSPTMSRRKGKVVPSSAMVPVPPIPPPPVVPYAVEKEDVVLDYTQVLDICLPPPPPLPAVPAVPSPSPPPSELRSSYYSSTSLKGRETYRTISTSTGSSSTSASVSDIGVVSGSSLPASARSSTMMKIRGSGIGSGAGGVEAPFLWASAIPVPVVPLAPPFSFGMNERGKLASSSSSSSSLKKEKEKEKGKRKRTISEDAESRPITLNDHDGYHHNHNDDTVVSFYEPLSEPLYEPRAGVRPEDGMVVTTTTTTMMAPPTTTTTTTMRIIHGADDVSGDFCEHEQETGVRDVIPHLRNLKLK